MSHKTRMTARFATSEDVVGIIGAVTASSMGADAREANDDGLKESIVVEMGKEAIDSSDVKISGTGATRSSFRLEFFELTIVPAIFCCNPRISSGAKPSIRFAG